jgi:hypothetical protein
LRGAGTSHRGDGRFSIAASLSLDGPARDLKLADFDGDGRADLAVALGGVGGVETLFGDATDPAVPFVTGPRFDLGGPAATLDVNEFGSSIGDAKVVAARADNHVFMALTDFCPPGTGQSVDLTSPNGGETMQLGSNFWIRWRVPMVAGADIEISRDGGTRWERIGENLFGTDFQWTVTPPGTMHGAIRVVESSRDGMSDASNWPFQITPLVDVTSGVHARAPSFSPAYPNPSRDLVSFDLEMPTASAVSVDVFDLAGRRIRRLTKGSLTAGAHRLVWDGRTADGSLAADGVYFVRARLAGYEMVRRVVHIE